MFRFVFGGILVLGLIALGGQALADEPSGPPIPRRVLFGNPDKANARISPDGQMLSYLAPRNGVLNIFVAPAADAVAARPITNDSSRGIRQYFWAYDNRHVLYVQDKEGDENWHVFSVDVQSGASRDLTPYEEIIGPDGAAARSADGRALRPSARIEKLSPRFPNEVLVALNTRDARYHDIHRINIETGKTELVLKNSGEFLEFHIDDEFRVRLGSRMRRDGSVEYLKPDGADWSPFITVPAEDTLSTRVIEFSQSGDTAYMIDSRGRNTAALVELNMQNTQTRVLAEDPRCDAQSVIFHPSTRKPQAVEFEYDRSRWELLDSALKPDFEYLRSVARGELEIISRALNDDAWVVAYLLDDGPQRYYHYVRGQRQASFLFTNRTALEELKLSRMKPVTIKSRDGMNLIGYLTLPAWVESADGITPAQPLPMVLLVHGGPWGRDAWGFNATHQWLANRGYAVLSVNFRGSTGFGKQFINAANREWGARMHEDLLDGVSWAVESKIADPQRVAIMGGSYGGYATLWAMTASPEVFACGVSIVGPSNLVTLLNSIPEYWTPMIDMFATRVGDHRTEEGRAFLTERSPLTHVERIKRPLLIGQGANDPRVKQAESDQIVKAMQERNIPVTYALFRDEGHGFARPENRLAFNAVAEAFLARHLGGRFEPPGEDFKGSRIEVLAGAEAVEGLNGSPR